jgi:hypothetical protein
LIEGETTKMIGGEVGGPKGAQVLPEKLERKEVTNQKEEFVITKASPMDNTPEKAQAN